MNTLNAMWARLAQNRSASIGTGLGVVALGVLLIGIGESNGWGWTRILGAGVISLAAALVGSLIGWSDPVAPGFRRALSAWKQVIIVLLTLIIAGPLLAGMLALLGSAMVGASIAWFQLALGVLITVFLFAITLATVVTAASLALRSAGRSVDETATNVDEQEST